MKHLGAVVGADRLVDDGAQLGSCVRQRGGMWEVWEVTMVVAGRDAM
jgi:hypothetical protein